MSIVVVTGANGGLGRAICERFNDEGNHVLGLDINAPEEDHPWSHHTLDIADYATVAQWAENMAIPDVVIHCAGITRDKVIWKMEPQQWADVLAVNLTGAFNLMRCLSPGMKKRASGCFINISSINAQRGKFGQSNYVASKAGLEGLTRNWAIELGKYNIRVNAVAPGMVETPLTQLLPDAILARAQAERLMPYAPNPVDIANAVYFLATDQARCITGQVLTVDSGQVTG